MLIGMNLYSPKYLGNCAFKLSILRFNVGIFENIGSRQRMEDSYLICQDLKVSATLKISVFAVFDGHGGSRCSEFMRENFVHCLRLKLLSKDFDQ